MAVRFDAAADRLAHNGAYPQTSAGITGTMWVRIEVDRNDFTTFLRFSTSNSTTLTYSTNSSGTEGPNYYTASFSSEMNSDLDAVGKWVPLAFTRSSSGDEVKVYRRVGGGSTTTFNSATGNTGLITGTPDEICLGGRGEADSSEWLNGSIAYVRIWSAELTQSEIEAEWASATPVRSTNLHSNWPLTTATDLTDTVGAKTLAVQAGGAITTATGPSLGGPVDISSTSPAAASVSGQLDGARAIAGSASSAADLAGELTVGSTIALEGLLTASDGAAGTLRFTKGMEGSVGAASSLVGSMGRALELSAGASSASQFTGSLSNSVFELDLPLKMGVPTMAARLRAGVAVRT